jgi:tetratricopeptide (TPR) repeat protein
VIEMPDAPGYEKMEALLNRGDIYMNDVIENTERALSDYTTVIEMSDATEDQKARALVGRGFVKSLLEDYEQAISDYALVIEMPDAPEDQKVHALVGRGHMNGALGYYARAVSDYTLVIEMQDALMVSKVLALVWRGHMNGALGYYERAVSDYTLVIEMQDAPADQKAQALVSRGATYSVLGNIEQAIADYTLVIEMQDAPVNQKAQALVGRGLIHNQPDHYQQAIAGFDEAIRLKPDNAFARLHRVVSLMHLEAWDEAFDSIKNTLTSFPPSTTGEAGDTSEMIRIISQQTVSRWYQLVPKIVGVYQYTDALDFLGKGLVASLGALKLPAESLTSWEQIWREASGDLDAMHVPMRLFAVGIRYLKSVDQDGGDERLLYDLPMEEARILRSALGLEAPDD